MQLEGTTALITGGGRGIGRSITLAYATKGANIAVVSRTTTELDEVTNQIRALGRKGLGINADLTKSDEASREVNETIEAFGTVDVLVNNAGGYRLFTADLSHQVSVADITEEEWRRVIHSNLTTTFLSCKAALPHMMERGSGSIINLTSRNVARKGRAGAAAYGAAKAAVERLTESMAEELIGNGIAVNCLDPGWVLTRPNDDYDDEVHKRMRLPEDIGEVAVYLALQIPETLTGGMVSAPDYDKEHGIQRATAYERLHT